ncbi:MAG TPA: site-2 protease family protein [Frankiaceae bacterium]|nr:site-2 protease family protein [Frankiaceae bacterium]
MALIGALAFVLALLVSVVLHEGGHFATAKLFGMKATQFFVGFGPTVWSRRKGETEYGIKAIPAGGFVKIVGMTPLEELEDPDDEKRAFYRFPAGRRAIVLVAGSTMHFVLAIVLVFLALLISPIATSAAVISTPATCLSADATKACTTSDSGSPAQAAGLKSGDRLISVGGTSTTTFSQLRDAIRADNSAAPLAVKYERDGTMRTTTITPVLQSQPTDSGGTQKIPVLGITAQQMHVGPVTAARKTITTLGTFVTGTVSSLAHFPQRISTIFSNHRDPNGAVGVIGISRVSGDLLSGGAAGGGGIGWDTRIGDFLLLVAGVNLFVGFFNLLPLMPLDGGHLAVLGFEQVRDRLRRLRGYRGPLKRVDLTKLLPATYAVVAIFATLTLVLAAADIVNPIRLG